MKLYYSDLIRRYPKGAIFYFGMRVVKSERGLSHSEALCANQNT